MGIEIKLVRLMFFYCSAMGDIGEMPEDEDDPDRYVQIPHKKDLDSGKSLVQNTHWHQPLLLTFDSETMPEWFGMPEDSDLPSVFDIEYVRAWKKK